LQEVEIWPQKPPGIKAEICHVNKHCVKSKNNQMKFMFNHEQVYRHIKGV